MPLFHWIVLRNLCVLRSGLFESAKISIRNISCWNGPHIPPPCVRRAVLITPDTRGVYNNPPTLPSRHLRTFLPDCVGRGCLPPRPVRRKLKIHRVTDLFGPSYMARKRRKYHYLDQRLLVLRRVCDEVRACHTTEEEAWLAAIWTNADHLHHGVPNFGYTRYVQNSNSRGIGLITLLAIFSILQYTTSIPSMDSNVLTLVSIFLPLSSIWASSSGVDRAPATARQDRQQNHFDGLTGSARPLVNYKASSGPLSPSNTATTRTSSSLPSPANPRQQAMYLDLEAQGLEGRQDRTMSGAVVP